ncbi:MAG: dihydrodipicolinate synthase family protein [Spirochaetales bacterium]|nr:dihydrodipicolinate synthase family protein [Spirochaetales bacterium]
MKCSKMSEQKKRFPEAILATCCIPWEKDFSLNEDMFRKLIRLTINHTQYVYIFGTAGEGYAVNESQYKRVVSVFADEVEKCEGIPMVGVISSSLQDMHDKIDIAKVAGIRLFQISLPCWDIPREFEIDTFFNSILLEHRDCQFLHYNRRLQGHVLGVEEYTRLSNAHPNLIGAKISSDSITYIHSLMTGGLPLQWFFTTPGFAYASMYGKCGLLIAAASINWGMAKLYFRSGIDKDFDTLMKYQQDIIDIVNELIEIMPSEAHIDGAYDKLYPKMYLPDFPLCLLPPYEGATEETFNQFRKIISTYYPDWL